MQINAYAVIFLLCLNYAFGEDLEVENRSKRQAVDPVVPPIIVRYNGNLVMVLSSVDLTVRQIETREEFKEASYTNGTFDIQPNGTDAVKAFLTFAPPATSVSGLKINTFDITMSFIKGAGGYWAMEAASVNLAGTETDKPFNFANTELISAISLVAPEHLSFHCSRFGPLYPAKQVGNHTFSIDLRGFQIHPFSSQPKFGEYYECVGFFTIGILSGIFVTILLMAIIAWGLSMIMSVKTMDRFDDPKGKPVSFGGSE